ncbi:MAG: outer membrane beta-barrel protein [Rhizobiaceae bacterium]
MKTSSPKLTSIVSRLAVLGLFAGAIVLPTAATAADMLEDYPEAEYTQVEFGTGWYLRGDLGGGISDISLEGTFVSGDVELDSPITLTFGAGRNFAEGIRVEGAVSIYENTDFGASTLMGNVYADLGTYFGLRPYIGAGAGLAYAYWNDLTFSNNCTGGGPNNCTISSGEELTYAANAMLGVSYKLSRSLNLDLGYRYTYFGEAGETSATDSFGATETLTVGSRDMHEVRLGLRYEIW